MLMQVTVWINKIFWGKRVPMLLRLEAWRVEILADDVHMQLAANTTFNTDLYKKKHVIQKTTTDSKTIIWTKNKKVELLSLSLLSFNLNIL